MNKPLTLETEQLSSQWPCGGNVEGTLFSLNCKVKMRFCFSQETLFIEIPEKYVKESSGNGQVCP